MGRTAHLIETFGAPPPDPLEIGPLMGPRPVHPHRYTGCLQPQPAINDSGDYRITQATTTPEHRPHPLPYFPGVIF
ncbi:hypothetical protein GCM10009619_41440 [Williamsia maris]